MKGRRAKALLLGAVALVLAGVVAVCFCCVRIEHPSSASSGWRRKPESPAGGAALPKNPSNGRNRFLPAATVQQRKALP